MRSDLRRRGSAFLGVDIPGVPAGRTRCLDEPALAILETTVHQVALVHAWPEPGPSSGDGCGPHHPRQRARWATWIAERAGTGATLQLGVPAGHNEPRERPRDGTSVFQSQHRRVSDHV